ncbi:hypothetical protein U1737_04770 [Sphingomonas sp. LB3N6]|uniref:gp53-like domain-containing protein n=1 Tax=Sphingomonas fucosidasi TaxID=3096164 RepID=UPI002FC87DD7
MLGVVVQIDGFDPVLGQPVTLRTASHDDPAVCHVDGGEPWWPALIKLPTLRYDLFDGAFNAEITAPSSSLTIAAEPWPNLGRYALADARLQLWTGDVSAPWGSWTLRFDGRVSEQPELADGIATINFAVDDRWLDTALLTTYAGTSGPEGTEALKGQPKPLALGAPRYVAGTLIDNINNVFQLSAYGPLHGFEAGLERLARFGNTVGDFASYAALVAANVPAGRWATAKAVGMARLGAPPTGQISFLVGGDEGGPNGWARRPGQIIRRLALLSKGAGRINDASLNALDAARPYNLSVNVEQQTTARQLIQQIAASVNAVAGMSWTGQLFVVPVGIGAPGMTLAADGSALPPVASVKQIGIASPFQKLAIGAARAWTVHALSEIAFTATLVDLGTYVEGTTYREGNIVSLADGSRWLYINVTAGAGHAPPAGTTGDGYWSNLSAPIAGSTTYADGTPLEDLKPAQPGADKTSDHVAKDTQYVDGKLAAEVTRLQDLNGLNILGTLAKVVNLQAALDAIATLEGQPFGTFVLDLRQQLSNAVQSVAADLSLIFAKNAAGTGGIINADTVMVGADTLEARSLRSIVVNLAGVTADVTNMVEILYDPTGTTLRSVNILDLDGNITGTLNTITGEISSYTIFADIFKLARPNGGQPIQVFGYGLDGIPEMDTVRVKTVLYEALVPLFGSSYSSLNPANGWEIMPSGKIRQWGRVRGNIGSEGQFSVIWPRPFQTVCTARGATAYLASFSNLRDLWMQNVGDPTVTSGVFATQAARSDAQAIDGFDWWAEGY